MAHSVSVNHLTVSLYHLSTCSIGPADVFDLAISMTSQEHIFSTWTLQMIIYCIIAILSKRARFLLLQKNLDMFYLSGQLSGRWSLTPVDVLIWRSQNFIAILTVAHKHLHLGFTLDDHLDSIYPYHKNNKKDYKKLMLNFIKRHFRL